jgi:acyl carrier protein
MFLTKPIRKECVGMFEKLCEIIADQYGLERGAITADTAFVDDLGADSVDLVDLSMTLEGEFGLEEMDEKDITSIVTVGDLYKYMQEHLDI